MSQNDTIMLILLFVMSGLLALGVLAAAAVWGVRKRHGQPVPVCKFDLDKILRWLRTVCVYLLAAVLVTAVIWLVCRLYQNSEGILNTLALFGFAGGFLAGGIRMAIAKARHRQDTGFLRVPFDFVVLFTSIPTAISCWAVHVFKEVPLAVMFPIALAFSVIFFALFTLLRFVVTRDVDGSVWYYLTAPLLSAGMYYLYLMPWMLPSHLYYYLEYNIVTSVFAVLLISVLIVDFVRETARLIDYIGALKEVDLLIDGKQFEGIPDEVRAVLERVDKRFVDRVRIVRYAREQELAKVLWREEQTKRAEKRAAGKTDRR